jgi:hypothetical protein
MTFLADSTLNASPAFAFFANCRILTPRHHALHVLHGEFCPGTNYPFSTPHKQKTEFRKQETA